MKMQTISSSSLPGYSSRRSSSVSVFHESNGANIHSEHSPIGIGISGLQSRSGKLEQGKIKEATFEPISPSQVSIDSAGTPPPHYSINSPSHRSTAEEPLKAPVAPIISSQVSLDENWISSKEVGSIKQLPYLTGMRAIATIIIELSHTTTEGTSYIYYFAWIALTTHFVQGAFLITGSLLSLQARKRKTRGWLSTYEHLPQFFLARWVRLYPAMIILLIVNSAWWIPRYNNMQHFWKMIFRVFFKISQTKILYVSNDNPPNPFANLWFLDVQEHFYIFWGLTLPFIAWFKTRGRFVCLAILFGLSFHKRLQHGLFNATLPLNLYKMVFGAALFLLPLPRTFVKQYASQVATVSIILATIWGISPRFDGTFTEDQHRMYGDNVGIFLVVLVTLAAIGKGLNSVDPEYLHQQKEHQEKRAAEDINQPWYVVQMHKLQDWEPLSLLDAQWLQFVGRVSYSWYLWQVPLMHYEGKFRDGKNGLGPTSEAFIIAMISTWFIEEPIRNVYVAYLKRQRLPKPDSEKSKANIIAQTPSTKDKTSLFIPNYHVSLQMPTIAASRKDETHTD